MSSRHPATVTMSLETLAERGGRRGPHADGWGIAFADEHDVRILREPEPAAHSRWVELVEEVGLTSTAVLAHVRLATDGDRRLANTQPFARELGGRMHVFAHNGHVPAVKTDSRFALGSYLPVGTTDSEHAFCALLERLRPAWRAHRDPPPLAQRLERVAELAAQLREHGPANFVYSDGDVVFAHAHRRTQLDRSIRPPGMHLITRRCGCEHEPIDGLTVQSDAEDQQVVLVASVPLTDEEWIPLAEGEVVVMRSGEVVERAPPRDR